MEEPEIWMVVAIIRPSKLSAVKKALDEIGAPSLTVTNVSGRGSEAVVKEQWRGEEYTVDLHQKTKIECVVSEVPAERVVNTIYEAAHTGNSGDGKIFVVPVTQALQIRTGNRGAAAI